MRAFSRPLLSNFTNFFFSTQRDSAKLARPLSHSFLGPSYSTSASQHKFNLLLENTQGNNHNFDIVPRGTRPPTLTMDELTASLSSLGVSKVPSVPDIITHPTFNQFDIYRSHITELLVPITGVDAKIIYPALQWTQTLANGDLMLPVPALRIKGKKPDAFAQEIVEKVRDYTAD